MTGAKMLTEEAFSTVLRSFERDAFHFEAQRWYRLDYEKRDFLRFLHGNPVPPPQLQWWQPWLERVALWTAEGKHVSRVRILEEPPTDYQRWLLWANPWHAEAGEDIRYMPRSRAEQVGLPLDSDWWLLDDERVLVTRFTNTGTIRDKTLITDPDDAGEYEHWRLVAIAHSDHAESVAAA